MINVWVQTDIDGVVLCAHCTCMAEVCSHIGAILFYVDATY